MDYREELLKKLLIGLNNVGIESTEAIRTALVNGIGDYEIAERCTDVAIPENHNEEIIKMFFATKRTEGCSTTTIKTRWYIYRKFLEYVNKSLIDISAFDVRKYLASLQGSVGLSTIESYRSAIRSLFNWMKSEGVIQDNPMKNVRTIKCPNPIKSAFSLIEVDSIKNACSSLLERAVVEVLLSSGLRCAELCNLKWSDIDFVTKDVFVIGGKGNKNRITMIDDVARRYLLDYKNSLDYCSEYVFASKYEGKIKKRSTSSINLMLKRLGERVGIKESHPHKFRRTFASTMYRRGMEIHMIQRLLGHSNLNTTTIYIDNDRNSIREAYKRCEG